MIDRSRLDGRHRGRNAAERVQIPEKLKNSPSVATPGTSATIAPKKSTGTFVAERIERYIVPPDPRDKGSREANLLLNRRWHISLFHQLGFEAMEMSGQSRDAGNLSARLRAVIQIVHVCLLEGWLSPRPETTAEIIPSHQRPLVVDPLELPRVHAVAAKRLGIIRCSELCR